MRSRYAVSSTENKVELGILQEHLTRLLGYDSNVHDEVVDKQGSLDTADSQLEASGAAFLDSRVYGGGQQPMYPSIYSMRVKANLYRRF